MNDFRCSAAACWLPRWIVATLVVATMLAAFRVPAEFPHGRLAVLLCGAILVFVVLRSGREVRTVVRVEDRALVWARGTVESTLRFDEMASVRFALPFTATRHWLPAALVIDESGRAWRLSALLEHGELLVRELIERSGRNDLQAWCEVASLSSRMARSRLWTRGLYVAGLLLMLASLAFYAGRGGIG